MASVTLADMCRLDGILILLDIVKRLLALSADSDNLVRVNLTSSLDSVVLEVVSVTSDEAAVTEDASVSSGSISISTTLQ